MFQADSVEATLKQTEDKLSHLLSGIDRLFKICKCTNAPLLELLGNNTEIHQYNVMLYLHILEKRIGELILSVFYKEKLIVREFAILFKSILFVVSFEYRPIRKRGLLVL